MFQSIQPNCQDDGLFTTRGSVKRGPSRGQEERKEKGASENGAHNKNTVRLR